MRIFRLIGALALVAISYAWQITDAAPSLAAQQPAVDAYNTGMDALRRHDFRHALPALDYAAQRGVFLAQYYLARLYDRSDQPFYDRGRAYDLLSSIVETNYDVDAFQDDRAPFVARAELLLAHTLIEGIPERNLAPDRATALRHLEHAALILNDNDAKLELARADLASEETAAQGLNLLGELVDVHRDARAAADLADLYRQGRLLQRAPDYALAYATIALNYARPQDRLWIASLHQAVYCATSTGEREAAGRALEELQRSIRRSDGEQPLLISPPRSADASPGFGETIPERVCANGEAVPGPTQSAEAEAVPPPSSDAPPGKSGVRPIADENITPRIPQPAAGDQNLIEQGSPRSGSETGLGDLEIPAVLHSSTELTDPPGVAGPFRR
jgi:uncharacterized protein